MCPRTLRLHSSGNPHGIEESASEGRHLLSPPVTIGMSAEILDGALEPTSLMRMDSGDLAQLAKSRIGRNGKYRDAGLSPAATMGALGFVFAGARHLTDVGRILRESMNAATTAFQGNCRRSNRRCLGRHREINDTAAGLGTTSHCEKIL